jgi:hypothetical protein
MNNPFRALVFAVGLVLGALALVAVAATGLQDLGTQGHRPDGGFATDALQGNSFKRAPVPPRPLRRRRSRVAGLPERVGRPPDLARVAGVADEAQPHRRGLRD